MNPAWPLVSLADLIRLQRRPVEVKPEEKYQEIGIYCFGRGVFHKVPRTGLEVGEKNLFELREGDLILQVTFAWEGAIALCSKAEDGLFGSTRYPTFRVDETRCYPPFLVRYLGTRDGLEQINKICPGSAGRNRVLSLKRISEVFIPLPPLPDQRRIVARIEELAAKINEVRGLRQKATEEVEALKSAGRGKVFARCKGSSVNGGLKNSQRVSRRESPRSGKDIPTKKAALYSYAARTFCGANLIRGTLFASRIYFTTNCRVPNFAVTMF
jgi:hypothetical protein